MPIALQKGKRSCTQHSIASVVSFDRLGSSFCRFTLFLSSVSIPKDYQEAIQNHNWKKAMDEEMLTLLTRGTWDLVPLLEGVRPVARRQVFTVKYHPNGSIKTYKVQLVSKQYTRTQGIDFFYTFSPVAWLRSVLVLISVAVNKDWLMYQLNIKNTFLDGDLIEEVYMEQPPGFVAQGETHLVCKLQKAIYGLKQSPRAWFDKSAK